MQLNASRDHSIQFGETQHREGFRSTSLSIFGNIDPDTLLREILQNAVDAGRSAKRKTVEISFEFSSIKIEDIPGIKSYQDRFAAALDTQERLNAAAQAKPITNAISKQLKSSEVRVLWVKDNGIGLDVDNMTRLLQDGQSQKGDAQSTGSYGNGHMTVFPASNLRFLLYGGVFRDNGELRRIVAGHSILAFHEFEGKQYGKDGYFIKGFQNDLLLPYDFYSGSEIPTLLSRKLDEVQRDFGHGAIVGILGFNDFNGDVEKTIEIIRRVVATHFTPSVHDGSLRVTVKSESEPESVADRNAIQPILSDNKTRTRRSGTKIGPTGSQAWQVSETLMRTSPNFIDTSLGKVDLRVRNLSAEEVGGSSIQLYRNGMWIANDIPHNRPRNFSKSAPFSAVILLDPDYAPEACEMVRNAEGPRHVDIDPKRIGSVKEEKRIQFDTFLKEIHDAILLRAPEVTGSQFDPGFFLLDLAGTQSSGTKTRGSTPPPLTKLPSL